MAAMVPPSHWTPEDDLLLKNSVEAGASLESLAKGAVQFSRRFTIEEIQERWYSLLYNPIVSEEASHHMTEIELSSFHQANSRPSKAKSGKETRCTSTKRKAESIRRSYYARQKRIRNEPFDMLDIDLLCGLDNSSFGDGNDIQLGDKNVSQNLQYPYGENISIMGDQSAVPRCGPSKQFPFCNASDLAGPSNQLQDDGNASDLAGPSFDGFMCSSPLPIWNTSTQDLPPSYANEEGALRYGGPPLNTELNNTSNLPPCADYYLAQLFDFTVDDELFLADNNSYLNELSLLLLDPTNQNDLPTADMQIIGASGAHSAGPGDVALHHCDEKKVPEAPVPTFRYLGPEYCNGGICCTLNTEDPDIPSNEDVFLLTGSSRSHGPSNLAPSSSARKSNGGPAMKKNKATGDEVVRFELPKSNLQNAAVRNSTNGELLNRIGSSINSSAKAIIREAMKMERAGDVGPGTDKNAPGANAEIASYGSSSHAGLIPQREVAPEPIDKPDVSDHEELWSENEFDAPYFSDVEAMILDMDLSADENDLNANPEVQRFQHEETKRTIIRLEQGANSCMQRAIAAQGALAVLYGRGSKHFIKKSEVLLGRATEDFGGVDIDLGGEKNGAKISRRQAIIKMDMHGAFHLTNVGKSSIHVNDREVAMGQNLPLTSGCLIEVRGLSFVFETNHARVQHHMKNIMSRGPILDHGPSIQR